MQKLKIAQWIESLFAFLRWGVLPLIALSFAAYAAHAATVSISANPVSVTSGAPSTLTWSSTDASNCAASGAWSGINAISGSRSVIAPNGLNTYILNCSGPGGSASNSVVIGAGTPAPALYALNVTLSGSGTVTSNPSGIACGATCSANYPSGAAVTLSVAPAAGYIFTGWSGACSGSGACVVGMSTPRTVTATFTQSNASSVNCTGPWTGSEENTTITAWPHRDCFRTNPVGTRTRMTNNAGAELVWDQGAGWNGQNALRVRPPDGSTGNSGQAGQGYAGLGGHVFHSVRTKRLNIRYLVRYNANWARFAQRNKWEVAIKYDYTNPSSPLRRGGCERGIVEGRLDPLDSRENMAPRQGVCTNMDLAPNLGGWYWGPGVRENEWIAVENEFNLETGRYRTYITTQDGAFNQSLHAEINITTGTSGAPAELVPNPYWWGSIDCTAGCYWDSPADQGVVPRPVDTHIWYSHVVISDRYIGPPAGFGP